MADWANAIAQGLGAAAASGAQSIDNDIKSQQQLQNQIQLEQTAADVKFDLSQRLAAADNMMKNQALNRYASVVKQQMGTPVPQEAQTVQQTGLTADSGKSMVEDDDQNQLPAGFKGLTNQSGDQVKALMATAQGTLQNPTATAEQKADAKALLAQLGQQIGAQKDVNESAVEGKTRARTLEEATDAANAYTLQNDPEAYVAGTTAYNNANKDDIAQKRLDQQLKLSQATGERQERIAQMNAAQREAAADDRVQAILAKLGPNGTGGGKDQANIAQAKWLMESMGMSKEDALATVYGNGEGLHTDPAKLFSTAVQNLLNNPGFHLDPKVDPPGMTLQDKAIAEAKKMVSASIGMRGTSSSGATPAGGIDPNNKNPLGLNLPGFQGN